MRKRKAMYVVLGGDVPSCSVVLLRNEDLSRGQRADSDRLYGSCPGSGCGLGSHSSVMRPNMAAEKINAAGGVMWRKIEVYTEDTESNAVIAAQMTKKLIIEKNIDVLLSSPISLDALGQLPMIEQYGVPMLIPIAVATKITKAGKYWLAGKTNTSDDNNNVCLATYIAQKSGVKRIGLLAENSDLNSSFVLHKECRGK